MKPILRLRALPAGPSGPKAPAIGYFFRVAAWTKEPISLSKSARAF
jgi:hypothetical protein